MPVKLPRACAAEAEAGFTLIELLIAIVILMVGIVAVAQIVPAAIDINFRNRYDSSALIVAQRQLEQMMVQPLDVQQNAALPAYNFVDADGATVYGGALPSPATAPPNQPPPAPIEEGCTVTAGVINFGVSCTATGYFKTAVFGSYAYTLRWNVVTMYGNDDGTIRPVMKRITLAARGEAARPFPPTSLSVLVAPR
ncbi:MAG: prepilin-type N-terminal cleavage/methylation domain-containing protein [Dehalococcoidia bacterium]